MVCNYTSIKLWKKETVTGQVLVVSKNTHNNLKRLLKYSSFFQLHIFKRPDCLPMLQSKENIVKRLTVKADMKI